MLHLHTLWFIVLAILWIGFFVLEGFDFGVGMLHMFTGRTDTERRIALNAIGPFWDGNEVWLVVAGAGTFAAFPDWYATWFSALYLALLLVLAGADRARCVVRVPRQARRSRAGVGAGQWPRPSGSLLIPLLLGIGLGDLLTGLPINQSKEFTGNFFDLLTPYGIWVGLTLVGLCLLHGCTFLKLKTAGPVRERARAAAKPLGWIALALAFGFVIWTRAVVGHHQVPSPVEALAVIATGLRGAAGRERDPRRMGLRDFGRGDRLRRRLDLHRPVSQRDGLEHQPRLQPHGQQLGLGQLRAEGDDDRDACCSSPSSCSTRAGHSTCFAAA